MLGLKDDIAFCVYRSNEDKGVIMNQNESKTVSKEVVQLQFEEWEYPSLEDAVLTFTMENSYEGVYAHTSRYKGVDNDLLPDTLIQHKEDKSMFCVYSPYEPLIDRLFQTDEDIENLQTYMNLECKSKVTFKFIRKGWECGNSVSSDLRGNTTQGNLFP